MPTADEARPVLVGGHESGNGADLVGLVRLLPGAVTVGPGRPLHDQVAARLADGDGPVVVVPMTWGRDPRLVAEAARTLHWLARHEGHGRLALSPPFGTADHLVATLRRAVNQTTTRHPGAAVVLAAPRADPFDDAELHRVAHLVRTHGAGSEVSVACVARPTDLDDAVRRARLLGAEEVVVVPAAFTVPDPAVVAAAGAQSFGPLMSDPAAARIVQERVTAAVHLLEHEQDGIGEGLLADHDHGYAHSHATDADGAGHTHGAAGAIGHTHRHPHAHLHEVRTDGELESRHA